MPSAFNNQSPGKPPLRGGCLSASMAGRWTSGISCAPFVRWSAPILCANKGWRLNPIFNPFGSPLDCKLQRRLVTNARMQTLLIPVTTPSAQANLSVRQRRQNLLIQELVPTMQAWVPARDETRRKPALKGFPGSI